MLAGGAANVVAALVFAVTLVGSYALYASAAGTARQNVQLEPAIAQFLLDLG